jgi:signal peptidase I
MMMTDDNHFGDEVHEYFCDKLNTSINSVLRVVRHLLLQGFDCELHAQLRPRNMRSGSPDRGDIHAFKDGHKVVIAVKQQPKYRWANVRKWTPLGLLIVKCRQHRDYVFRYYILDADMKVARVFRVRDWNKTYVRRIKDDTTGVPTDCYMAKLEDTIEVRLL